MSLTLPLSLDPTPRPFDVVTVGENSVDIVASVDEYPQHGSKRELGGLRELPGGEAAAVAVGVARLGWKPRYVGSVGDDRFGELLRQSLQAEGVDVSVSVRAGVGSRAAVLIVDRRDGARTVLWRRDPALTIDPDEASAAVLGQAPLVLVGSDDATAMAVIAGRARGNGARVVGDLERVGPGTDDLVREIDVAVMAASFPSAFTGRPGLGEALRATARASGAAMACVTLGEDGCLAIVGDREVRVPAFRVEVVDTTGAGDLFRAGLLARWLMTPDRPDVLDLLRYASAVAALNCRGEGAWTAAPTRAEVEELLHRPVGR